MTAGFWLDRGDSPLWRVHLPETYTPEEFDAEFAHLIFRLEEAQIPLGILINVHLMGRSHSRNRERAGRFFREQKHLLRRKVVGWAFVTRSPVIRAAIATIGLIGAFPIPTKTFETNHAATQWLRQLLKKRTRLK